MVLEHIDGPKDLKRLSAEELDILAKEIREEIIRVVSRNGGHLAPSLGTVELTLALLLTYDSPRDKIIWDVGHQAYGFKLLTGRRREFPSIRTHGGLSGYLRRSESPHDIFGAGHASTAISAAVGVAKARDLLGEEFKVVAVVGDGALTGGLAYEGLNNAGHLATDLVIVLNDNSMSISPNVGSVSTYLTRLRSDPTFSRMKRDIEAILRRIPVVGDTVAHTAERLKDSVKYVLTPGALFEELGVRYFGPLDGHDLHTLRAVLERARNMRGPVLLHVVTEKGHGYPPAAADPGKFHGTGSFDPKTGKGISKGGPARPSWSQVFAKALIELAQKERRIVAITAAMADGTGLVHFAKEFPDRFFDVGIAEAHAVTFAAGLATQGFIPVAAIYSTFLQRAYDQIIHDVAVQGLHVVFCLDRAGLVGEDGATHNGLYDIAYLRAVPGMTIAAPRDAEELARMLEGACRAEGPVAIRYPRGNVPETIPGPGAGWGEAEVLCQGPHATILALGSMVETALKAADLLAQDGVHVGVVDARFAKPLDRPTLAKVLMEAPAVITLEEGTEVGGFGEAVLHLANEIGCRTPLLLIGVPDRLFEHGTRGECLEDAGLTPRQVAARIGEWVAVRRHAS